MQFKSVAFLPVIMTRKNLQIPWHMEPAYCSPLNRDDVIDVKLLAALTRQTRCLQVHGAYCLQVNPRWRRSRQPVPAHVLRRGDLGAVTALITEHVVRLAHAFPLTDPVAAVNGARVSRGAPDLCVFATVSRLDMAVRVTKAVRVNRLSAPKY